MYTKHVELAAFEWMFRANNTKEEDIKHFADIFDQVYELGYNRGKMDAMLQSMMGETEQTCPNNVEN